MKAAGRVAGFAGPLRHLPRGFALVSAAAPGAALGWVVLAAVQGALPIATMVLAKLLVDRLAAIAGAGGSPARVYVYLGLIAAVVLVGEGLDALRDALKIALGEALQDHVRGLVHRQATAVDLDQFESPEFHDLLERVRGDASGAPVALLEQIGSFVERGVALPALAVVVLRFGWWVPLLLLATGLPVLAALLAFDGRRHAWWRQTTVDRRRAAYLDALLTHPQAAAEVRLFALGPALIRAFQEIRSRLLSERIAMNRGFAAARLAAAAFGVGVFGALTAWLVGRVTAGESTPGDLALFLFAAARGQSLARSLAGDASRLYTTGMFLENLFAFVDLTPRVAEPEAPVPFPRQIRTGIEFRNVTFRYLGADRPALERFSALIPAGATVAVVGPNGAGKSTLLRLLCRFSDPTEGSIHIDGHDIRSFSVADLRAAMAVLAQNPVNFCETARGSIALGDDAAEPDAGRVEAAADAALAHEFIERLPRGYDTMLGKWFDGGVELSAGQWRRIALARAYVRRAAILVLDEPTSLMDPWDEARWFERFRAAAGRRTAVLVTHRFTLAMRTDRIFVVAGGRLVESGTHAELLEANGSYAASWADAVGERGEREAAGREAASPERR